jgi:drug/metabolite transporter (DMT)-like permease
MDAFVFFAVLAAAMMHAGWNALVKTGLDRTTSILLLALIQSAISLLLLPFFALPLAASWPWIALSAALHTGYKVFLIRAYAHGDLSQVYPLARGSAPLIVALVGVFALNEGMTAAKLAAVILIGLGVIAMSMRAGDVEAMPKKALLYALGTALFTASYTLVDGVGARISGTASGFTLWMFVIDGLLMTLYACLVRGRGLFAQARENLGSGVAAGALSLGSYWIAIWAFTLAPIALVAALRETSVLFAMLAALARRRAHCLWCHINALLAGRLIDSIFEGT